MVKVRSECRTVGITVRVACGTVQQTSGHPLDAAAQEVTAGHAQISRPTFPLLAADSNLPAWLLGHTDAR